MPLIGARKHIQRLRRLSSPKMQKAIGEAIYEAADAVRAEAHRSISAGSVSGKNHRPSAPGHAPNRDTGILQAHLKAVQTGRHEAEVRSEAPYSAALEFGTSKMAARPFLRPARDKVAKDLPNLAIEKINRALRSN
ncbi:HK97-gp10 family putative phage morphogenesis protein [Altericroceibacterium xinjiangense]|uniref:HK97-gp10 family putative phage morphogenesis protein n=1 Tax=Altericroceibacterium xinjiangense TaxID=762261 RepID=UPI000F7D8F9E|nr:HK97-gp10 family putative phage morphogenesis protein [Altericroceibacterium xinjiangense]